MTQMNADENSGPLTALGFLNKHMGLVLCGILSAVVLNTCLQIEVWNYLAGGNVLPNREGGKLRSDSAEYSDRAWRHMKSIDTSDESLRAGRPLTAKEQAEYQEAKKKAHIRNHVVSWHRGLMHVLQFFLAPIALVCSSMLLIILILGGGGVWARLIAGFFVLTNIMSVISYYYRV